MNLERASIIVPLMDVVARWVFLSEDTRFDVRSELKFMVSGEEFAAVSAFLDALDKTDA